MHSIYRQISLNVMATTLLGSIFAIFSLWKNIHSLQDWMNIISVACLLGLFAWIIEYKRMMISNNINKNTLKFLTSAECFSLKHTLSNNITMAIDNIKETDDECGQSIVDFCGRFSTTLEQLNESMLQTKSNSELGSTNQINEILQSFKKDKDSLHAMIETRENKTSELYNQLLEVKSLTNDLKKMGDFAHNITSQINLLAMSSTIEAANATSNTSKHNFVTVANEVKTLAKESVAPISNIVKGVYRLTANINESISRTIESSERNNQIETESYNTLSNAHNDLKFIIHDFSESSNFVIDRRNSIHQSISDTLVALQFQDRASQILSHSRDSLSNILETIEMLKQQDDFHLSDFLQQLRNKFNASQENWRMEDVIESEIEFF